MSKKVIKAINRPMTHMPCGRGLFFINDIPFVQEIFPILRKDTPNIVEAFVYLNFDCDDDGYANWQMSYCHVATLKGMIKQTDYSIPPIEISKPANTEPESFQKRSDVFNTFQNTVMGERTLFGYPLIVNYLDYLTDPKLIIETHLDDMLSAVAQKLIDYRKTNAPLSETQEEYIEFLINGIYGTELQDFMFDILVPKGQLLGIDHDYCVMPSKTLSNPFRNQDHDIYMKEIPLEIERKFQEAILKARQTYGLKLGADINHVDQGIEKLRRKFKSKPAYCPSNHIRHKRRINPRLTA